MEKQSKKINWKELTNNQLICTVLGWILGIVSTVGFSYVTDNPILHDYISIDSVSYLAESYLVDTGFVDTSVLEEESLDKKFQLISESFVQYEKSVETAMVSLGEKKEDVVEMERAVLLSKLPSLAEDMADKCADKDEKIEQLNGDITALTNEKTDLQNEVDDYKQRKEAEIKQSYLIIDGELMNNGDSVNNAVAIVEGNQYYSEALLNTYLYPDNFPNKIQYDMQEDAIVVGNAKPEKLKFSWESMVFNPDGPGVYTGESGKSFSMAKETFTEGVVLDWNDYFYVRLKGEYSKMSFTYGHIDGSALGDLDLTIVALDDDNEGYTKTLATITLDGEMTYKSIEIPIGYADAIKIVVSDYKDWDLRFTEFGLTDIYFYS